MPELGPKNIGGGADRMPFVPLGGTNIMIPAAEALGPRPTHTWHDAATDGRRVAGTYTLPESPDPDVLFTTLVVEADDTRTPFIKTMTTPQTAYLNYSLVLVTGRLDRTVAQGKDAAHPTIAIDRELLQQGLSHGKVEDVLEKGKEEYHKQHAKKAKEHVEKQDEIAALTSIFALDAHPVTTAERRQEGANIQAERRRELEAIVVDDNEHDPQAPEPHRQKAYIGGKVIGVEVLQLGSDDPEDRTVYTYLEVNASNTAPFNQTPVHEKRLAYNVDVVRVSLMEGINAETGATKVTIASHREPLATDVSALSTDSALRMGKKLYAKREAEMASFVAHLDVDAIAPEPQTGIPSEKLVELMDFVARGQDNDATQRDQTDFMFGPNTGEQGNTSQQTPPDSAA